MTCPREWLPSRRGLNLLQAAADLSGQWDEANVVGSTVLAAVAVTGARRAALRLYDGRDGDPRWVRHGWEDPDNALALRDTYCPALPDLVPVRDGPVRWVAGAAAATAGDPAGGDAVRCVLGVPVGARGRRYGDLYVLDKAVVERAVAITGAEAFDEADEHALTMLAVFAAAAIDRARLVAAADSDRAAPGQDAATACEGQESREETLSLVIAAQEEERARVARDLHDEIGQAMALTGHARTPASIPAVSLWRPLPVSAFFLPDSGCFPSRFWVFRR